MKSTVMVKEIYEAFKSVGADDEVASAAAQAVPPIEHLATKADIAEVKAEIADVRGDVAALKGEVADLKGDFANFRGGIYRHLWLMGSGLLAAMIGLKFFD